MKEEKKDDVEEEKKEEEDDSKKDDVNVDDLLGETIPKKKCEEERKNPKKGKELDEGNSPDNLEDALEEAQEDLAISLETIEEKDSEIALLKKTSLFFNRTKKKEQQFN